MKEKLKEAQTEEAAAHTKVKQIEQAIIEESDIKVGNKVKIIAEPVKHKSIGSMNGPSLGNEAIGLTVEVIRINVNHDGELSYTTNWRDPVGLLWCWERNELKLI